MPLQICNTERIRGRGRSCCSCLRFLSINSSLFSDKNIFIDGTILFTLLFSKANGEDVINIIKQSHKERRKLRSQQIKTIRRFDLNGSKSPFCGVKQALEAVAHPTPCISA